MTPQSYKKISDFYFLCSAPIPICISIQTSGPIIALCLVFNFFSSAWLYIYFRLLHCDSLWMYCVHVLLCYLVLWTQDWINTTTTTTTTTLQQLWLANFTWDLTRLSDTSLALYGTATVPLTAVAAVAAAASAKCNCIWRLQRTCRWYTDSRDLQSDATYSTGLCLETEDGLIVNSQHTIDNMLCTHCRWKYLAYPRMKLFSAFLSIPRHPRSLFLSES